MALTIEEETFVKSLKKNSDLQKQIEAKEAEMWVEVGKVMKNKNYPVDRKAIKDQYRAEIDALKDQLEVASVT